MSYRQYNWLALATALAAVVPAALAAAQPTVDQILEKYTQAIGGQSAYEKVTTRAIKGTLEVPDDNVTTPMEIWAKAPASFHLAYNIPGYGTIETVVDGANGWEKNPDAGVHAMSKVDLAVALREHNFYREVRLKQLYPTLAAAGASKVAGRPVYVIEATPATGTAEKLYFDAESGLLVKRDFERVTLEDGIVQYEMLYKDYRDVDGLKLPHTIEQRAPDNTVIFKFAEIKNNAPVEDTAFAKPEK